MEDIIEAMLWLVCGSIWLIGMVYLAEAVVLLAWSAT